MTLAELKRLKSKLPKRWRKELQKRTGLSFPTIDRTFLNKHPNQLVIDEAINLAREYQDELARKRELINSL